MFRLRVIAWLLITCGLLAWSTDATAQDTKSPPAKKVPTGLRLAGGGNSWYAENCGPYAREAGIQGHKFTHKLGHTEYSETAIFADFDRDGDLDIVAGYRAGKLVVYRNSKGVFDDGTVVFENKEHPWTQQLYWRDLDRDGQSELFCAKGPWGNKLGTSFQLVPQAGSAKMTIRWQSSPQTAFHAPRDHDQRNTL